ncbi:trans-sulfuration enzyme family protein [Bacillus sp. FJAT-44742]|uniref:trans-sulfuration enzyme family protein n=1 Tax=Bacillus sp. FJAT-44742 TaxID=2014005 RepID=UPI000C248B72|nr:PLP-dependent aspartate aminotransferase family protein [Bacillus sp. FJAT-44742]
MTKHFNTQTVHFQKGDGEKNVSKTKPIYQTSAFTFESLEDMESYFSGEKEYLYTRYSNPNPDDLGAGVAQLEGAPAGAASSSGMSAILAGVMAAANPGEHIIVPEDLYGGTYQLFEQELKEFGYEISVIDFTSIKNVEEKIKDNTVLLYSESIANPLLRAENLQELVSLGKTHNLTVMIDNTFATPYLIQPYKQGADIVVHSATKYIGGHSDVTAGVVVGNEELIAKAKKKIINLGGSLSPFEAWLACRGLKTLSVRMERQCANANELAVWFREQEDIKKVYYPEAVSERGNGAMVSIELEEYIDLHTFFSSLDWVKIVPTLAGVETTVSYPLGTSHRTVPEEIRKSLGITAGIVRISVGIEESKDIIEAFNRALQAAKK